MSFYRYAGERAGRGAEEQLSILKKQLFACASSIKLMNRLEQNFNLIAGRIRWERAENLISNANEIVLYSRPARTPIHLVNFFPPPSPPSTNNCCSCYMFQQNVYTFYNPLFFPLTVFFVLKCTNFL